MEEHSATRRKRTDFGLTEPVFHRRDSSIEDSFNESNEVAESQDEYDTDLEDAEKQLTRRSLRTAQRRSATTSAKRRGMYNWECEKKRVPALRRLNERIAKSDDVTLKYQGLGKDQLEALTKSLNHGSSLIRSVDLTENFCTRTKVPHSLSTLISQPDCALVELNLCGTRLATFDAINVLRKALINNSSIVRLDLSRNELGDKHALALAEVIETNRTLATMILARNEFGPAGGKAISEALVWNPILVSLDFSWNPLLSIGGKAMGPHIAGCSLKDLNLSMTGLGVDGATSVCKGIAKNDTLTSIDLSANRINGRDAIALTAHLVKCETLERIKLGPNPIPVSSSVAILKTLLKLPNLKTLDLENVCIDDKFLEHLEQAPRDFRYITGPVVQTNEVVTYMRFQTEDELKEIAWAKKLTAEVKGRRMRMTDFLISLQKSIACEDDPDSITAESLAFGLQKWAGEMNDDLLNKFKEQLGFARSDDHTTPENERITKRDIKLGETLNGLRRLIERMTKPVFDTDKIVVPLLTERAKDRRKKTKGILG